jgi:hypothetical protein
VIALDERHREIVKHQRFYGNYKQQSMKWMPYLTQLSRCPGALKYTGEYSGVTEPPVRFMMSHPSGLVEPVFRKGSQWFQYRT